MIQNGRTFFLLIINLGQLVGAEVVTVKIQNPQDTYGKAKLPQNRDRSNKKYGRWQVKGYVKTKQYMDTVQLQQAKR